jgi:hypothetical protein
MEKTYQNWMEKISKNGMLLEYVPESMRTPELCLAACQSDGDALICTGVYEDSGTLPGSMPK